MSMPQSRQPLEQMTKASRPHKLRRVRAMIVSAVALIALLSATVAIGQASRDFDLACRGILAAGGRVSENDTHAVIGALGVPIVPPKDSDTNPTYAVRSATFGVRAGFLPAYPNHLRAVATEAIQQDAPALNEQALVQRLPLIFKAIRIIRDGC